MSAEIIFVIWPLSFKWKQIIMSKVLSQVDYGLSLYLSQTDAINVKVNTLHMKCYNEIIIESTFIMGHRVICDRLKLPQTETAIKRASASFFHRIIKTRFPAQIHQKLLQPRHQTGFPDLRQIKQLPTRKMERTMFYSSVKNYNKIPEALRSLKFLSSNQRYKHSNLMIPEGRKSQTI